LKHISLFALCGALISPCVAQEQSDYSERFTRISGGAVYDEKMGVDGAAVSETYVLTHVTCSKGSHVLRVLLPVGLDDDGTVFNMDGPASTLQTTQKGYTAEFASYGKRMTKDMVLKPINDQKSLNKQQFEISLEVGDALWTAMRDTRGNKAMMFVGTGGLPVNLPRSKTFSAFLAACGLNAAK
jgi:hypothetical protein